MIVHHDLSIHFVAAGNNADVDPFFAYLQQMPHVRVSRSDRPPPDPSGYDVVITIGGRTSQQSEEHLSPFVQDGGGWLALVHLDNHLLPSLFGAQPEESGVEAELRILFEKSNHPMAARLPDAYYLKGRCQALSITDTGTDTILYADWHYRHIPVMTARVSGRGRVACTTLQHYGHDHFRQILYRTLRWLAGRRLPEKDLGVGLLGYAPSVGRLHAEGAAATPGLALKAVCDLNPQRILQVQQDFPQLKTTKTASELAMDPEVDLVIVSTPPNTHARLCLEMMKAGKHVVCEKPLALKRSETDALVEAAAEQQLHLSCHQNRRWDPDYLAIRSALTDGLIGDPFYMETFVGGFSHPCGYWHSHQSVSGGTAYDWGAHYLDWMVSLVPASVDAVVGTLHKRVWHDVTNADQERIQIRFAGGLEAEFIHSDIAAATKPKWYILGTKGAIVSRWQQVSTYEIDRLHYFRQHDIPSTEMPPELWLSSRLDSGDIETRRLSLPARRNFAFHQNLADHLLLGEPLAAPLEDSVQVVSILEAAAHSAASGGTPVTLSY